MLAATTYVTGLSIDTKASLSMYLLDTSYTDLLFIESLLRNN